MQALVFVHAPLLWGLGLLTASPVSHPVAPTASTVDGWTIVERLGAVVALIGVPYLVNERRRQQPRFSFNFMGSSRQSYSKDGLSWCRFTFEGTIRNHGLQEGTIEHVCLVVWGSARHRSYLRFGYGASLRDEQGVEVGEPLRLRGHDSRRMTVVFDVVLTGTQEVELVAATKPISGTQYLLPRYDYEVAFEDQDGHLFHSRGGLVNRKALGLRWTLPNARIQHPRNPVPHFLHVVRIQITELTFLVARIIRAVGL